MENLEEIWYLPDDNGNPKQKANHKVNEEWIKSQEEILTDGNGKFYFVSKASEQGYYNVQNKFEKDRIMIDIKNQRDEFFKNVVNQIYITEAGSKTWFDIVSEKGYKNVALELIEKWRNVTDTLIIPTIPDWANISFK